jgi:hypothetical protein
MWKDQRLELGGDTGAHLLLHSKRDLIGYGDILR